MASAERGEDSVSTTSTSRGKIKCSYIFITVDESTGETVVTNDGLWIPIERGVENLYNHTLIFGHLLTSSNYDDTEERGTSGRNGLGAKLTNVFSTSMSVSGTDPERRLRFEQTWTENMRHTLGPKVTRYYKKAGSTRIAWTPDFGKFPEVSGYTSDVIAAYRKAAIDTAMLTGLPVHFNGEKIQVRDLLAYARMFENDELAVPESRKPVVGRDEKTAIAAVSYRRRTRPCRAA